METNHHEELKKIHEVIAINYEKFHTKGVKTAGTRLRNSLMDSRKLVDLMRKDVLEKSKEMPVKKRTDKKPLPEQAAEPLKVEEPLPEPLPEQAAEPVVAKPEKPKKVRLVRKKTVI